MARPLRAVLLALVLVLGAAAPSYAGSVTLPPTGTA